MTLLDSNVERSGSVRRTGVTRRRRSRSPPPPARPAGSTLYEELNERLRQTGVRRILTSPAVRGSQGAGPSGFTAAPFNTPETSFIGGEQRISNRLQSSQYRERSSPPLPTGPRRESTFRSRFAVPGQWYGHNESESLSSESSMDLEGMDEADATHTQLSAGQTPSPLRPAQPSREIRGAQLLVVNDYRSRDAQDRSRFGARGYQDSRAQSSSSTETSQARLQRQYGLARQNIEAFHGAVVFQDRPRGHPAHGNAGFGHMLRSDAADSDQAEHASSLPAPSFVFTRSGLTMVRQPAGSRSNMGALHPRPSRPLGSTRPGQGSAHSRPPVNSSNIGTNQSPEVLRPRSDLPFRAASRSDSNQVIESSAPPSSRPLPPRRYEARALIAPMMFTENATIATVGITEGRQLHDGIGDGPSVLLNSDQEGHANEQDVEDQVEMDIQVATARAPTHTTCRPGRPSNGRRRDGSRSPPPPRLFPDTYPALQFR